MGINEIYTPKQIEVLRTYKHDDWRMMINYGAVRAGKTVIDNDLFLLELKRVKKLADKQGVDEPMYILAGVSSKTIQNNVLQELTNKYGIEFKFDKHGSFNMFGVKVVTAFTGSIAGLGSIRGMTAYGAYINEASLANEEVFNEIDNRCSAPGSRIILDTNPDNPEHWLKRDYIDNHDKKAKIVSFHFTMEDNTFLDPEYISTKKASTPSGMFYDRSILGLWVSGDGMVYRDFDKKRTAVEKVPDNLSYYVGVDWGYAEGHAGVMLVFGDDSEGNVYLLEEYVHEFKEVAEYWLPLAKELCNKYGKGLPFFCDTARPEYVAMFRKNGLNVRPTSKAKLPGIESVASFIKKGRFFVLEKNISKFYSEIYTYVWDDKTGEPVKKNDDTMDALRYAVYNYHKPKSGVVFAKGGI